MGKGISYDFEVVLDAFAALLREEGLNAAITGLGSISVSLDPVPASERYWLLSIVNGNIGVFSKRDGYRFSIPDITVSWSDPESVQKLANMIKIDATKSGRNVRE